MKEDSSKPENSIARASGIRRRTFSLYHQKKTKAVTIDMGIISNIFQIGEEDHGGGKGTLRAESSTAPTIRAFEAYDRAEAPMSFQTMIARKRKCDEEEMERERNKVVKINNVEGYQRIIPQNALTPLRFLSYDNRIPEDRPLTDQEKLYIADGAMDGADGDMNLGTAYIPFQAESLLDLWPLSDENELEYSIEEPTPSKGPENSIHYNTIKASLLKELIKFRDNPPTLPVIQQKVRAGPKHRQTLLVRKQWNDRRWLMYTNHKGLTRWRFRLEMFVARSRWWYSHWEVRRDSTEPDEEVEDEEDVEEEEGEEDDDGSTAAPGVGCLNVLRPATNLDLQYQSTIMPEVVFADWLTEEALHEMEDIEMSEPTPLPVYSERQTGYLELQYRIRNPVSD